MTKQRILKIRIGETWDNDKKVSRAVFVSAFEKQDKNGNSFFEIRIPIFVNEFEKKEESLES